MRFDLSDLRLFLHVVEAGSITHGAERMHLAIAAASTRIRNMEAALGTPLLHRERQGVQPTPAGRTLVHHARLLLQQAERMHGELAQYAEGIKGQVRLLSNTNALTEFLPEPISDFLASHPQVNIDLEERLSDEIVAAVADGTADIGIVAATVEIAGLETLPFRTDRFVLVVAPQHPLARVGRVTFAEVLDCDFVGLDRTSALQRFLSEKAERIGRRLRLRVQLRSFDAVCRLVECNVGIGIVPATTAERHAKTMSMHRNRTGRRLGGAQSDDLRPPRGRPADLRPRPGPAFGENSVISTCEGAARAVQRCIGGGPCRAAIAKIWCHGGSGCRTHGRSAPRLRVRGGAAPIRRCARCSTGWALPEPSGKPGRRNEGFELLCQRFAVEIAQRRGKPDMVELPLTDCRDRAAASRPRACSARSGNRRPRNPPCAVF